MNSTEVLIQQIAKAHGEFVCFVCLFSKSVSASRLLKKKKKKVFFFSMGIEIPRVLVQISKQEIRDLSGHSVDLR